MATPATSLATLRPELAATFEEFDLEMDRQGFIASRVMPVVEVDEKSGNFGKLSVENLLQTRDTARAAGTGYSRNKGEFDDDSYNTKEHGAEEVVDDNESAMYRHYFDHERVCAARARDAVLRNAEIRVAAALFNSTTFNTTTITNEWDDYPNATPITDIEAAIQRVYDATGIWPNACVLGKKVFRNLRNVTQILDRIKYSGRDAVKADEITASMLAELFGLDEVVVGGAAKNTANEEQAATIAPIWSDEYCLITKIATSDDFKEPSVGRTFHWGEDGSDLLGTVESYRDESIRSDVVRVRHQVQEKILYASIGELLDNVTT